MRKFFAILLILTLCTSCLTAFAWTEDELDEMVDKSEPPASQMMYVASKLGYTDGGNTNAPTLTLEYTENGYQLHCTYYPEKLFSYLQNNRYYTIKDSDYMYFNVHIQFDGQEIVTDWYGPLATMMRYKPAFDHIPASSASFVILETGELHEDVDTSTGPYHDIIEIRDNHYFIDLAKHKISVSIQPVFVLDGYEFATSWTPTVDFMELSSDALPTILPTPQIDRVVMSTEAKHISMRVLPDYTILAMQDAGHDCKLLMRYTLNGDVSKTYETTYDKTSPFTVFDIPTPKLKDDDNTLVVEVAYYNKTTNTQSEWLAAEGWIQQEPDSQLPSTTPNDDTQVLQCGLCGRCPVQPMGICLWMVIAASVTCITAVVIGIMPLVKKAQKSNNKEKPACQSKNLKTPK